MLDRLLRGRAWIALLGVLLIGLVALNVSLLKLNAEAGRDAEIAKKLSVENADLRGRVSRLGSGDRLQTAAAQLGLVMPAANDVHYLTAHPALDARRAARHSSMTPLPDMSDLVSAAPEAPLAPPAGAVPVVTPAPATAVATSPATTGTTGPAAVAPAAQPTAQAQPVQPQPSTPAPVATGGTGTAQGTTP